MLSTYIPGFTNMLEQPEYQGGPAYVGALPAAPAPGVRPSAPPIMQAPTVQPSAPPPAAPVVTAPPPAQPFTAPQFSDLFPNGIDQETLAAMLSTAPGAVVSPAASQPGPGAGLVTTPGGQQGFYFYTDKGRLAGYGGKGGFIAVDPNAQYRMWDERGKNKVIVSGTGQDALQQIYNTANQFNKEQGKKANWGIERLNPATGKWERVAENDPAKNIGGKIADIALPVAASFIPGVGPVLGAALGSAASSVAQGRSLENTLMRAGLSAATAGAMKLTGVDKAISGALNNVIAPTVSEATKTGLQKAAEAGLNEIIVSGTRSAIPAIVSGAVGSGLSSQLASMVPGKGANFADQVFQQPTTPAVQVPSPLDAATGSIDVLASRLNPLPFASAGAGALAQPGLDAVKSALEQQAAQTQQQQAEEEPVGQIDVVATPEAAPDLVTGALPSIPNAVLPTNVPQSVLDIARAEAPQEGEIIVTPTAEPSVVPGLTAAATPNLVYGGPEGQLSEIIAEQPRLDPESAARTEAATAAAIANNVIPSGGEIPSGQTPTDGETTLETEDSLLDKLKKNLGVTDYMRLAALGIGLLGGGGGGNRGALATIPSGLFGGGSGVFGGRLPAPTLPGVSTGFAPRTADDLGAKTSQDWYRYGYGPEQSFFSYVPKGEPNTSRAYTGYEQAQSDEDKGFAVGGMAGGGMRGPGSASNSYAVKGPGTGRSDEIPALLSDGEYVIDAETVALLGDGSSKAGAERLDQLRVKIRKDKGRKLAKGEFSGNAKRPEHYLKGGRA